MTVEADGFVGHERARAVFRLGGGAERPSVCLFGSGAASAAFAGVLGRTFGAGAWTVEQGVEMGRPSRIAIAAEVLDGTVGRVQVGGGAVRIGHGTLTLPPAVMEG